MEEHEEVARAKEKLFRGKDIEFLKGLDVRESAKYLTSSSRRSIMRHFDVVEKFVKSCEKKVSRGKRIKTHLRDIVIVPRLVGMNIQVYNGKSFQDVPINIEMIGHRLGEFAFTREKVTHSAAGIGATRGSKAAKK